MADSVHVENQVYYDWSNPCSNGFLDGQYSRYATMDIAFDECGDLYIVLRRKTKNKSDFLIEGIDAKDLYEMLKEHFED
jgi:hypothetical protein